MIRLWIWYCHVLLVAPLSIRVRISLIVFVHSSHQFSCGERIRSDLDACTLD